MRNTRLGTNVKIVPAVVPSAGSVAALTAVEVDGTGYNRVLWVLQTGAQAVGGTLSFKIQNAAATGGSFADQTSAALVSLGASAGSKIYTLDAPVDPTRPFMNVVGAVGTDTIANSVIAILYKGSSYPVATTYATQAVVVA
jgi:hypothetical protein